jgi:CubicO group peptidase (beta-lactamase class C family)
MLDVPMAWNSGDKIVYCSGKPNLAGGMLEKIAGEPLPEMFDRLIGRPLHMGRYHLFLQPTGEVYGGGGHRFTSRDFLKWAQLMLNDGKWEGRQVFTREWAEKSGAPLRVLSPRSGQTYGYLWNSVAYDYRGKKLHAFFAGGNGGQISMGIPELGLAIVFTGGNYADPVLFTSQRKYVPEFILPAVK